ncbi:YgaP family membrane protein [Aridibaculum aurantiacum]|uniref:YgaP family membrane protein n=1 Tax=Aridibaculum aurantiacum TaxID=2810307 RepID=UPI001A971C14|nr:DUF2892 domain-containing protein [Aridibaculum aurantiacum]
MKKNIGTNDKIVRLMMACLIVILYYTNAIEGNLATALLFISGSFVGTAFLGVCPVYTIFGINTCEHAEHEHEN